MATHQAVAMAASGQRIEALQHVGENPHGHPITFLNGG
jgi:hypothetical protein